MTESAVVYTNANDSETAAAELSRKIADALPGGPPDALIVFASARYQHGPFLRGLQDGCSPKVLVGASSAGEFTSEQRGQGLACALALRSTEIRFSAGVGRGLSQDRVAVASQIVSSFQGLGSRNHVYRSALVMTDALAGHADDLIDQLTLATAGKYQIFGGGA